MSTAKTNYGITISESELAWLRSTIGKRAELAKNLRAQPKLKAAIATLNEKLSAGLEEPLPGTFALPTNRTELLVLGDIIKNTIRGLEEKVIPAYQKGMQSNPDVYKTRGEQAKALLKTTKALATRIDRVHSAGQKRRPSDY